MAGAQLYDTIGATYAVARAQSRGSQQGSGLHLAMRGRY